MRTEKVRIASTSSVDLSRFLYFEVLFSIYLFSFQAVNGLPTILVYKKGELIGNFVRLTDEFGDDMHSSDIESFLVEYVVFGFDMF